MSAPTNAVATARWWRPLARGDRYAIGALGLAAFGLFVIPALLGHPAIDADNLIQNFPLRVLAGRQIASGHLPLLDPLTNAGTPLLGGMNAGALYPLTVLFAFIPPITAWLINIIVVYVTASLGVFVLLRWHGLSTSAALAAGVSYAYTGAMVGQMVHLGVVQGYSFVPWVTVLVLALSRRFAELAGSSWSSYARAAPPWIMGVAALWGLTFLTGEPRAIAVIELLTIVLVPGVLLLRSSYWIAEWRARWAFLATLLVGFGWGLGLGLVQLLPGWSFIHFSQRSQVSYWFFGAGSLAVRWTLLLLSPILLGGNGSFDQQGFFANYNLAEVTGYAGVLALMALAAFVTQWTRRGWKGANRDFSVYVIVAGVGLFAAWGNFTPVGHLFRAIPLFGSTRLQSRNIILVDFALAALLGWWFQRLRDRRVREAGLGRGARWVTAAPALLLAALSLTLVVAGPWAITHLTPGVPNTQLANHLQILNGVYLVIALLAMVSWWRRDARRLLPYVWGVLALDIVVFLAFSATGLVGGAGPREASRSQAVALLGTRGRFALVDNGGAHTSIYRVLGEPNMNVFTGLASVQGYGALISTIYDNATGTHPQTQLNPCRLADGTFAQLRLSAVAISAGELSRQSDVVSTKQADDCVRATSATTTHRYFGEVLRVQRVRLVLDSTSRASVVRVRLVTSSGVPVGPTLVHRATSDADFTFATPRLAAGFVLTSSQPVTVTSAVAYPAGSNGVGFTLNNPFQLAVDSAQWRLTSTHDGFSVFTATSLLPRAWLVTPASGRVTSVRNASWGDTWVSVTLTSASTLERSEAYLPGWRATALNEKTGATRQLSVHRAGLIESVRIPRGEWTVHFHYHAPYIEVSTAASAASLVLFLGVGVTLILRRRTKRQDKVQA